jgi:hypothetical protein
VCGVFETKSCLLYFVDNKQLCTARGTYSHEFSHINIIIKLKQVNKYTSII